MKIKKWRINFQFKWFDLWMGLFIDTKNRCFYFIPFPTLVIKIQYEDCLEEYYPKEKFGFKDREAQGGDVYVVEDKSFFFRTRYIEYRLEFFKWRKKL